MPNVKSTARLLMLLPLVLLLAACATPQTSSQPDWQQVKPAAIPALPEQARQLPPPPSCSPTCLSALTKERESWRRLLTSPAPGG
jgi:hypothetical protein